MKNAPNKAEESCSDSSCASNECILAELHSRESCEKSFSRCDRVASSPGTGAEVLRAQIDVHESSLSGCCPRLHRFQARCQTSGSTGEYPDAPAFMHKSSCDL